MYIEYNSELLSALLVYVTVYSLESYSSYGGHIGWLPALLETEMKKRTENKKYRMTQ